MLCNTTMSTDDVVKVFTDLPTLAKHIIGSMFEGDQAAELIANQAARQYQFSLDNKLPNELIPRKYVLSQFDPTIEHDNPQTGK